MDHDAGTPLDSPTAPVSAPRRSRRLVFAISVLLLMLAAAGLWAGRHWLRSESAGKIEPPPAAHAEDPRLLYSGPFQNIHPDAAFVEDEKCAKCHREKALSFHDHPMGRSLLPVSRIAARQRYDAKTHNPFKALGTEFLIEPKGDGILQHQIGRDEKGDAVYDLDMPVDYVLGSGTRGYSCLSDRNGFVFQTPVSWYSQKQIWDTSPGIGVQGRPGRPVIAMCLFCHANRAQPIDGSMNRYEEPLFDGHTSIGCERCHGPGSTHAKKPGNKDEATGIDYTIVNPRHLKPELRAAVCEQCHLAGEARLVHRGLGMYDFRPGLPLEAFWSIYVRAADPSEERKAVNHVEQMYQSRCFLRSEEKPEAGKRQLGCTSCHDPHQHVGADTRVAYYRARCLDCHREQGCSEPEATRRVKNKDDSCIDCHMPKYPPSDIAHTAATNHHIVRPATAGTPAATYSTRHEPRFVSFYGERSGLNAKEADRDLGLALVHIMVQFLAQRKAPPADAGNRAINLLDEALRDDPNDMHAWESKAEALALLNRPAEALAIYEAVLAKAPNREVTLMGAAMLAQSLQRPDSALAYFSRAAVENPYQPYYRGSLAQLLVRQRAWEEARQEYAAWLRLDPANMEARLLLVSCLVKSGDKSAARAEFAKIERLRPPNLAKLQARFAEELRAR